MKFEVGDIVFVNHLDSLISKLFSKVMNSKWSHSAVVWGEINGEVLLLETNDYCVCPNFLKRYIDDKNCTIEILRRADPLQELEKLKLVQQGAPLIGTLYGYLQLISLFLRIMVKRKIKNFFRQGLVCCHVIGYCYKGINSIIKDIDPESYDTEEIYKVLLKHDFVSIYKK